MKKRFFLPVAALGLCLKPFLLGALAADLGLTDSGGLLSSFMRYLMVPEAAGAVCLFFLWLEPSRHASFRPLAIVLQASSVAMVLLALPSAGDIASIIFEPRELALAALRGLGILVLDLAGLLAALLARPDGRAPPAPTNPESEET